MKNIHFLIKNSFFLSKGSDCAGKSHKISRYSKAEKSSAPIFKRIISTVWMEWSSRYATVATTSSIKTRGRSCSSFVFFPKKSLEITTIFMVLKNIVVLIVTFVLIFWNAYMVFQFVSFFSFFFFYRAATQNGTNLFVAWANRFVSTNIKTSIIQWK